MTGARAPWTLALALVSLVLAALGGPARANETQRLLFDAGLNLGLWQVQVAVFDTPVTDPAQIGYATNAYAAVEMVRDRVGPPFVDLDLQAVLDAIARYPQRTLGLPARQRAVDVAQIRDLLHGRVSVVYVSTLGVYAAPNCDGAFVDVGYHLGRAQMAAFAGDDATLANARSMLLQAVRMGLDAARDGGCGFNLASVWNDLGIERANTAAEYQGLTDPIRTTAQVASPRLGPDDPWSPSDPARDAAPPPDDPGPGAEIVGTWRYETGVRVVFRSDGDLIVGTSHGFSSTLASLGYTEGMESHRLRASGPGTYVGQTAVRGSDGVFRWKDVQVTVTGDTAVFGDLYDGGQARYVAVRER